MNTTPASPVSPRSPENWGGLRKVIANTPGFQYWRANSLGSDSNDLDGLIQLYLRETLETLAY